MDHRERVKRTVNFMETDRVAFNFIGTGQKLIEYLNLKTREELYRVLDIDIWMTQHYYNTCYNGPVRYFGDYETDPWGIPKSFERNESSSYLCPLSNISSIDEVERYKWPEAKDWDFSSVQEEITRHSDYYIVGNTWAPIFHNFGWLCGLEQSLILLMTEAEITKAILRNITDFWIDMTEKMLEAGKGKIDAVRNCNDFGVQRGLLMNPQIWREFIKPELKRLYEVIKKYDAKVWQHSCGSIVDIIPDLIEIGADIIEPVQVAAEGMSSKNIAEKFGGKVVFNGGIDTQHVLPNGSEQEVRKEVREVIKDLNQKGGYILCGSQAYLDDIPAKNILAIYDEARKITGYFK